MSTPPNKRLRATETRAGEEAADSDPAGRLLHHLRDREGRASSAPPSPFGPGARVRVLRGTFAGRSGVVQELDGRGGARVMLGLLSARIDLADLATGEAAAPSKVTLSSSHRKPR